MTGAGPPPRGTGWIVTNPPYGERIGNRADARAIMRELKARLNADFTGWSLAALTTGRADGTALETRNGGIPIHLRILTT
jgi:23S rRNA (guanine2445-N2)-methyltransferase / 23S rRNA (guanine2069-N7)-methyltransferase